MSNSELVESYEKILSRELLRGQHDSSEHASLENQIDATYDGRWKQMQVIVEAALKRKKERSGKRQKIGSGLAAVRTTMSQAVRTVPEAAVAWTGVCFALDVRLMEWYWHLAELLLDNNTNISAPSALRTVCRYYRQHGPPILRDVIKADNWTGQLDDVRNAEAIVLEESRIFNALEIQRRLDEIDSASRMLQNEIQDIWPKIQEHILSKEEERCLKDLRVTDPRDDKSRIEDTNGGLLQGAYGWAIKHTDFIAWRDEKANHLLWIKDDAGKGKTMLLCGIIDDLQNRNIKPCYFFRQATDPRLNSATAILRGLIYLLVDTNRQLLSHIQEKYDQAGAALFQDANSWVVLSQMFTKLLDDPSLEGQVFMIDALDECQADLERLLDLLVGKSANSHARWIVSSRNWTGIEAKLGTISQKIRFSLELNEESVSEAVSFFVAHKTAQLKEAKGLDDETELLVRNYLTDHARGTFLWVSLVCKQLSKMEVRERHVVKKMTELVAVVYRPISLAELASLLDVEDEFNREDLKEIVTSCGPFLVIKDDVVRFVHQSAQDFLLQDGMFISELGSQHYVVFSRSLDILSATLRRDMYNLRRPGALIEEYTPNQDQHALRHAQYSCIYWVDHLQAVNDLEREKCMLALQDDGIVHHFFNKKLLNWLEALSLMRKMPDAVRMARTLKKLKTDDECIMRNLIEDIHRFVLSHKVGIELAPLQVYSSALIFMSQLQHHTADNFSPDGTQLASGSVDQTAKLWDLETGSCLHTFECLDPVFSVAFSPNSKYLATGLKAAVNIWDLITFTCLHSFQTDVPVKDLTFSFDSAHLAVSCTRRRSSGDRYFVRTWHLNKGMELQTHDLGMLKCHCTIFAPDQSLIACVAADGGSRNDACIWNLTTNKQLPTLDMDGGRARVRPFSPDAARLAAAANNGVWIYDTSTGACRQRRGGQYGRFTSQDGSFEIWDSVTGACLRQLNAGRVTGFFGTVAVPSPDGMLIAEASQDTEAGNHEIRIWDMTIQASESSTAAIGAMVFSPDGAQLAILSGRVIETRDPITGARIKQFEDVADSTELMTFFPDGKRLASCGYDGIEIWNVSSGVRPQTISAGSNRGFTLMAVSSNGNLLAATTLTLELMMWDLSTGTSPKEIYHLCNLTSEDGRVPEPVAVAFSPDDARLSLTLDSDDVCIFDIRTEMQLQILHNFYEPLEGYPRRSNMQLRTEMRIFENESSVNGSSTKQGATGRLNMLEFSICKERTWILKGKQRVLWLPPEYRPTAMAVAPKPPNIPSPTSTRLPSNIPLRTLPSRSDLNKDDQDSPSASLLPTRGYGAPHHRPSSESETSSWTDTGDIGDQYGDDNDPVRIQLPEDIENELLASVQRRQSKPLYKSQKKVRIHDPSPHRRNHSFSPAPFVDKEAIEVPDFRPRPPSRAERCIGFIMAGSSGSIHGLTGKALIGPYFIDYFNHPSKAEVGTMVAILEIGAFISSLIVGRVGDIIGRRRTILYGSCIFFVGGALQTLATSMAMMMLGRIVAGLGVGMLSTIVPVYQSEISPPHNRGKLACIEFSGNIVGYATSVWVDYGCGFIESDLSWRVPLMMQCIMGALLALGSLIIVESPRWLLDNDHDEEGMVVIANLYGAGDIHNAKARDEYREIKMNVLLQRQEGERSYADMFRRYRTRVFIAMSAQALAQLNGINVISYYAPYVFQSAGWVGHDAVLMTGLNGITYFLSTIPPWYLVDRWGRRMILLTGAIFMAISLSLISYFLYLDVKWTPRMVVLFVMIYNAAFGYSWGPIPWLYPPEILPLSIRSKGASLSTATNWAANWLVGEMTPILQEWIQWRLYLLHAFFCVVSFVIVYFIYPETCGVRLEDMDSIFGDASTVATPSIHAETGSLIRGGSPIGSGRMPFRSTTPIPGLSLDTPDVNDTKAASQQGGDDRSISGWLSRVVNRGRSGSPSSGQGQYAPLGQQEDDNRNDN
ncbi:sugar transporter domain-containing protein [Trichoderma barbatum]